MMGVVYRDLKPENVLVRDDGHIMLSDFDLSLRCDVVPRLLKQQRPDGTTRLAHKNARGASSYCVMPPMQPVLSCFYGGASKCTKKNSQREEEEEEGRGDEVELKLDPELVAEPITARSKSFVGTHEYLAPEVISGTGHGSAVDWWTLGVFLYEMIYGRTPFKGETNEKTLINILKQPLSFPSANVASGKELEEMSRAQDLIRKLLAKNPKKRLGGMKGSVEIKRHAFFKGVNWALIRSVRPPEVPGDLRKKVRSTVEQQQKKLSKKEREEPFQIPQHFDYF